MVDDLIKALDTRGVDPIGADGAPRSVHVEHRDVHSEDREDEAKDHSDASPVEDPVGLQSIKPADPSMSPEAEREDPPPVDKRSPLVDGDGNHSRQETSQGPLFDSSVGAQRYTDLSFSDYKEYSGLPANDPRSVAKSVVVEGIVRIVEVEGPIIAKRIYEIYLRSCGIRRLGHELKSTMNKALADAVRQGLLVTENEVTEKGLIFSVVRMNGSPPIKLRNRGPRSFEEIPASELQVVAKYLLQHQGFSSGSDEHLRAILECFDLKRLTTQVGTTLLEFLRKISPMWTNT
jgi:hypothetical protein